MGDQDMPLDDALRDIALSWREMRRSAAITTLRQRLLGEIGGDLEQTQYDTLEILSGPSTESEGWRMGELADQLHVDASTSTRTVDRLVASGWVERRNLGGDRRVVIVALTEAGRQMIDAVNVERVNGMRRLLAPFSESEIRQLAGLLGRFVTSMDTLVSELSANP